MPVVYMGTGRYSIYATKRLTIQSTQIAEWVVATFLSFRHQRRSQLVYSWGMTANVPKFCSIILYKARLDGTSLVMVRRTLLVNECEIYIPP